MLFELQRVVIGVTLARKGEFPAADDERKVLFEIFVEIFFSAEDPAQSGCVVVGHRLDVEALDAAALTACSEGGLRLSQAADVVFSKPQPHPGAPRPVILSLFVKSPVFPDAQGGIGFPLRTGVLATGTPGGDFQQEVRRLPLLRDDVGIAPPVGRRVRLTGTEPVLGDHVAHPFVDLLYLLGCVQIGYPRVPEFFVAIVSDG